MVQNTILELEKYLKELKELEKKYKTYLMNQ